MSVKNMIELHQDPFGDHHYQNDSNLSNESAMIMPDGISELPVVADQTHAEELAKQLMTFHPGYQAVLKGYRYNTELAMQVMIAAANLAIVLNASPLPGTGELHIGFDEKNQKPFFQLGYQFWNRRSKESAGGIVFKPGFNVRQMTELERKEYQIGQNALACICVGMRKDDFDKYELMKIPRVERLEAFDMFGQVGHGIVNKNAYAKMGRDLMWTAGKAAWIDLLKKLCPDITASPPLPSLVKGANVAELRHRIRREGDMVVEVPKTINAPIIKTKSLAEDNDLLFGREPAVPNKQVTAQVSAEIATPQPTQVSAEIEIEAEIEAEQVSAEIDPEIEAEQASAENPKKVDFIDDEIEDELLACKTRADFSELIYKTEWGSKLFESPVQIGTTYYKIFGKFDPEENLLTYQMLHQIYEMYIEEGVAKTVTFNTVKSDYLAILAANAQNKAYVEDDDQIF